jgi:hypothetical protein
MSAYDFYEVFGIVVLHDRNQASCTNLIQLKYGRVGNIADYTEVVLLSKV